MPTIYTVRSFQHLIKTSDFVKVFGLKNERMFFASFPTRLLTKYHEVA